MASEAGQLERFRAALNAQRIEGRDGYCYFSHIDTALGEATYPRGTPSAEYPRMMFLRGDREKYRIVANAPEEAQAASAGYLRTANPPDPDYPKYMIEDPQRKRWDYRGVTLHSKAEEAQFEAAVNGEDWIEDSTRQWGARPIGLETLVEERKQMLKSVIDQDLLEVTETSDGTVPRDADTDAESA